LITRSEAWTSVGWIVLASMRCDFCTAAVEGELGDVAYALGECGWTRWIGGLAVCPDCRERMATQDREGSR
jgi:hypothetical protein